MPLTRPDLTGQLFFSKTQYSSHDVPLADLAEHIKDGRLQLFPHEEVKIPLPISWSADPLHDANWRFQYHSLFWLDRVRQAAIEAEDADQLEWYGETLRSWVNENPRENPPSDYSWFDMAVGLRVIVLAHAIDHFGLPSWLADSVQTHGEYLADPANYDGKGNHGLHQDMGLIVAGQILQNSDWISLAEHRILDGFDQAIDDQGVGCTPDFGQLFS